MSSPASPQGQGSSTRPYLIRALHEWCTDNGFTPYIAVHVDGGVQVPKEYVKNNEIVLNVSIDATSSLALGNDAIRFKARFGYEPHAMTIGIRQALELLEQAFAKGHTTPEAVKAYLLTTPAHQTSLGRIVFDQYGDVSQDFYFIRDVGKELQ